MGKEVCWKGDIYRERSGEKRGSLGRDSEKKKRKWKGNMVRRKEILRVDKEGVKMMIKY